MAHDRCDCVSRSKAAENLLKFSHKGRGGLNFPIMESKRGQRLHDDLAFWWRIPGKDHHRGGERANPDAKIPVRAMCLHHRTLLVCVVVLVCVRAPTRGKEGRSCSCLALYFTTQQSQGSKNRSKEHKRRTKEQEKEKEEEEEEELSENKGGNKEQVEARTHPHIHTRETITPMTRGNAPWLLSAACAVFVVVLVGNTQATVLEDGLVSFPLTHVDLADPLQQQQHQQTSLWSYQVCALLAEWRNMLLSACCDSVFG